jgi:hypothetical protein
MHSWPRIAVTLNQINMQEICLLWTESLIEIQKASVGYSPVQGILFEIKITVEHPANPLKSNVQGITLMEFSAHLEFMSRL